MEVRVISSLNPNAEPFVPMAYRLVEDFSPLWWELVKTSRWFQDYWSAHHRFDDYDDDDVEDDDGFGFVETQYVNGSSSPLSLSQFDFSAACDTKLQYGAQVDVDAKAMLKKMSLGIIKSTGKERDSKYEGPAWYYKNKQQQQKEPTKYAAPKSVTRRIQQPR